MALIAEHIISKATQAGIHLYISSGKLGFKQMKGAEFTAHLKQEIIANKQGVIDYLLANASKHSKLDNPISKVSLAKNTAPMSFAQQRLWLLDQIDGGSQQYNMPASMSLNGAINTQAIEHAFTTIIQRHQALRTTFVEFGDNYVQYVQEHHSFKLITQDFSQLTTAAKKVATENAESQLFLQPFDLANDLLLRACLIKLSNTEYLLLVSLHHIASDGWSMGVLVKEFSALYQAFVDDKNCSLPSLEIQYTDYANWQQDWSKTDGFTEQLSYWQQQLKTLPVVNNLPLDAKRPTKQGYGGKLYSSTINQVTTSALTDFCKNNNATLFMGLYSVFALLIARYSNEEDIAIGSPIANREQAEVKSLIGFFVNNLVLRSDFSAPLNFVELIKNSKKMLLDAYKNQQIPFEHIVEQLKPERSLSHSPLFQIMIIYQNNELESLELPGVSLKYNQVEHKIAKYELTLNISESGEGLFLEWEYNTDIFSESTIQGFAEHFSSLMTTLLAKPDINVLEVDLLSAKEYQQTIVDANMKHRSFPDDSCIHELIEQQAKLTPNHVAIAFEGSTVTYQALNEQANQLAHYLVLNKKVTADTLVGICVKRSPRMIIALLAILKSGAAYLPLDSHYPISRLQHMIDDSEVKTLLTERSIAAQLNFKTVDIVELDQQPITDEISAQPRLNVVFYPAYLNANKLAYVIYTSGSTGQPKGVMIEHQQLVNFICSMQSSLSFNSRDNLLAVTSISFDIHTLEVFLPLISGGKVVVASEDDASSPTDLAVLIREHKITFMQATPSTWNMLVADGWQPHQKMKMLSGGEAISQHLKNSLLANGQGDLWNMYGPTETCVWSSLQQLFVDQNITIGEAIANTSFYILNKENKLLPKGIAGELHIGGIGLARGYLKQPELSAEKFIDNPFYQKHETNNYCNSERLYKTGDLVRRLPDGNLIILGRIDQQVKIRGFRIELGEIEHHLSLQEQVIDVIVIAQEKGEHKQLVAYVITDKAQQLLGDDTDKQQARYDFIECMRDKLIEHLPDYMVPASFVLLDEFPLTPNGKIDRIALSSHRIATQQKVYIAPHNETEKVLCDIWQEVLGLERVGIDDNFFELGGHSLLATQVIAKVRHQLKLELKVTDIFTYQNIALLAETLQTAEQSTLPLLTKIEEKEDWPLSFAQKQFWLIEQVRGASSTYNMPVALELTGKVDSQLIEQVYRTIIDRHPSFRTGFYTTDNGQPAQKIYHLDELDLSISRESISEAKIKQTIINHAEQVFDLARPPLIRLAIFVVDNARHILLINMHHIISDGWSIGILMNEFTELYAKAQNNEQLTLPQGEIEYTDYCVWQQACFQPTDNPDREKMIDYWLDVLADAPRKLSLPVDYIDQKNSSKRVYQSSISLEESQALSALSRKTNSTLFSVLLSGLNILLAKWTGDKDIVIGSIVSGRNDQSLDNIIGCFINMIVLRTHLRDEQTLVDICLETNKTVLNGLTNQELPIDLLIEKINPARDGSKNLFNNVSLRLQNTPTGIFTIDGTATNVTEPEISSAQAQLELMFEAIDTEQGLQINVEYDGHMFSAETIALLTENYVFVLKELVANQQCTLADVELSKPLLQQIIRSKQLFPEFVVAANFTVEPIQDPLLFWAEQGKQKVSVNFSPYNQVIQQLLDHHSDLLNVDLGRGIILIRWQDWFGKNEDDLFETGQTFISALELALASSQSPLIVMLCPTEYTENFTSQRQQHSHNLEQQLAILAEKQERLTVIATENALNNFEIKDCFDNFMDSEANIPYTLPVYSALATSLYRQYFSASQPQHKVIVLDCDNTLWQGVCGEVGALGVVITEEFLALQRFMLTQHKQGILLCLNSKNNEQDVVDVFEQHPDMLLSLDHIVAKKINWQAKSGNLIEISQELNLGLDSFIFVDDDSVQCAEVRSRLPQVNTIQLPNAIATIPQFIQRNWLFDLNKTKGMGAERSKFYQEDQQRHQQKKELSLAEFIDSLALNIEFQRLTSNHVSRASELSLRTNQFNLSTRRHSEEAIEKRINNDKTVDYIIHVSDRFGDYGDVGIILSELENNKVIITDFMLSCRAMGRGVEHAMLKELAEFSQEQGISSIDILFVSTDKNQPAELFLHSLEQATTFASPPSKDGIWNIATNDACELTFQPSEAKNDTKKTLTTSNYQEVSNRLNVVDFDHIAVNLGQIANIQRAVDDFAKTQVIHHNDSVEFVAATTEVQHKICAIWQALLGLEQVGIHDNFFTLGGNSLLATRLVSQLNQEFSVTLALGKVFSAQTVELISDLIEAFNLVNSVSLTETAELSDTEMELTI
jgi:amino acid adenylation domain-containing protein/FkbH-like protein